MVDGKFLCCWLTQPIIPLLYMVGLTHVLFGNEMSQNDEQSLFDPSSVGSALNLVIPVPADTPAWDVARPLRSSVLTTKLFSHSFFAYLRF